MIGAHSNVLSAYASIVQEEMGVNAITFTDDYADALALKANRLAPYDIPTVDVMLAAYTKLGEEIATRVFDADTMTVITALKSVREQWDTTNDTTIASSYQNIYGATLSSNPEDAWNVYNRLTAVQKKKLASEYATLISTLKSQTQETTDTVNIYCVGDSLTNGVTSTVTTEQAYPAQLQALLGTDAYTVTKHAEGGTTVYAWTESLKAFTSSTKYTSSLDGSADIVILQLGTNDLDYITDDETRNTYLAALENLIHSYLRLDNSPYLIISNTSVNYRNVNSAVAELNLQLAYEYGIPCVDLYAYTSAYSSDEQDTYYADDNLHFTADGYADVAQVFCNAVQSLTTEFDTADVTGYSFDESYLNSFLTPELHSATIKNETDPAKQGLGFETFFSKYHRTGADIVAYGTIFSRYKSSADYSDMTLENVGNGLYFKATLSTSDDSGLEETSYIAGINCSTNEEFKKVYIARSYVVYKDAEGNQTVYYSINTRTDKLQTEEEINNAYKNRVGVVNGYATRSLISVAKTMIKALAVQGITDSNVATYDEATDTLTVLPTATENDAVAIFAFLCGNQDKLDAVYKTVYLSASGSDTNAGTSDAPYATLDKALASVPNDGTIAVVGDYALASGYAWNVRSKAVTITGADSGGNLDFTAVSNVVIGNDVTFENITLTFNESDNLFANGHTLVIGEGVTTPNLINVYGGGRAGSTVASTNVTLLSGSYKNIYGGSFYGTVTGDTWLTVGGTVNPGSSVAVHEGTTGQRIYAGGNTDTIGGDTHCTFEGSAQAYQLFGGSVGADAQIAGVSNIEFNSGSVYGIYGGNDKSSNILGANVTVTGGTIVQIFGANQNSNMGSAASKATVNLEVLGGTITRRIYGGCYNDGEYVFLSGWEWADTGYHVVGNINLTLSGNANITFSEDAADLSIYACSRWSPAFDEEVCKIIFDASGYSKYYSKLGFNDSSLTNKTAMSSAMGSVDPCDSSNAADFE
ncbi:MAG: hypothetical protein IJE60_11715 [Tyzzerella sp.]|nr:hypothetical protein [Tyzzerella sp.]